MLDVLLGEIIERIGSTSGSPQPSNSILYRLQYLMHLVDYDNARSWKCDTDNRLLDIKDGASVSALSIPMSVWCPVRVFGNALGKLTCNAINVFLIEDMFGNLELWQGSLSTEYQFSNFGGYRLYRWV